MLFSLGNIKYFSLLFPGFTHFLFKLVIHFEALLFTVREVAVFIYEYMYPIQKIKDFTRGESIACHASLRNRRRFKDINKRPKLLFYVFLNLYV